MTPSAEGGAWGQGSPGERGCKCRKLSLHAGFDRSSRAVCPGANGQAGGVGSGQVKIQGSGAASAAQAVASLTPQWVPVPN